MILLKKHFLFSSLLFILIGLGGLAAQDPTVGLIYNSPGAFPGYTLFTSLTNTGIFLIDNCGKVVHKWQDDKTVANWMYLRKDGSLVRTAKSRSVNSSIFHGGGGELVQILDWEGNVTWEYSYANDSVRLHHDIALLPNGNILMLAWENFSDQEAIGQGRDPDLLSSGFLSPEHIIEVQPVGQDSGTIVWEWHVWDHLIQDFDSTKPNYGVVADHPELFDLNYINPFLSLQYASGGDWMHANSVSYNLELDQIMLSLQRWNELIIIDHSTTREEAASHTGGRYGKGGDILYRYGNPNAARLGEPEEAVLWGQHHISWIPEGIPGAGQLILFNNGPWRHPSYSEVLQIDPPQSAPGVYIQEAGTYFGPTEPKYLYGSPDSTFFYSSFVSVVQPLPNGNLLICEGDNGILIEVDREGTEVWRYANPQVALSGRDLLAQGDIPLQDENATFRATRYGTGYLQGVDLIPGDPLELNPWPYECSWEENWASTLHLYPNPATTQLNFWMENPGEEEEEILIWNSIGQKIYQGPLTDNFVTLDIADWGLGLYFVQVGEEEVRRLWIRE